MSCELVSCDKRDKKAEISKSFIVTAQTMSLIKQRCVLFERSRRLWTANDQGECITRQRSG